MYTTVLSIYSTHTHPYTNSIYMQSHCIHANPTITYTLLLAYTHAHSPLCTHSQTQSHAHSPTQFSISAPHKRPHYTRTHIPILQICTHTLYIPNLLQTHAYMYSHIYFHPIPMPVMHPVTLMYTNS